MLISNQHRMHGLRRDGDQSGGGVLCRHVPGGDEHYLFTAYATEYIISHYAKGVFTRLAHRWTSSAGGGAPIGTRVSVGGECTGSGAPGDPVTLTMTIDDAPVLSVIAPDAPLVHGSVGIFSEIFAGVETTTTRFDDISISTPAD